MKKRLVAKAVLAGAFGLTMVAASGGSLAGPQAELGLLMRCLASNGTFALGGPAAAPECQVIYWTQSRGRPASRWDPSHPVPPSGGFGTAASKLPGLLFQPVSPVPVPPWDVPLAL